MSKPDRASFIRIAEFSVQRVSPSLLGEEGFQFGIAVTATSDRSELTSDRSELQ